MDTTFQYQWPQPGFQPQYMAGPSPHPPPYHPPQLQGGGACMDEFGDVFVGGFKPLQIFTTPAPTSPQQFHNQPYGGHGYGYPPHPVNYNHELLSSPPNHPHPVGNHELAPSPPNPGSHSPASTLNPFSPDSLPITRTYSPQPITPLSEGASAANFSPPRPAPATSRSLPTAGDAIASSAVPTATRRDTVSSAHSHQATTTTSMRKRDRVKGVFGLGAKA